MLLLRIYPTNARLAGPAPQLGNNRAELPGNISRKQPVRIIHRNLLPAVFPYYPQARQEKCTEDTAANNQAADRTGTLLRGYSCIHYADDGQFFCFLNFGHLELLCNKGVNRFLNLGLAIEFGIARAESRQRVHGRIRSRPSSSNGVLRGWLILA